ncbi:hypothetical protein C8T65DRAFT_590933 [Cerioporus squamosus]|nr:hypothetical protein C8T65DRAFT_590933 [Cerioporus squamosus]
MRFVIVDKNGRIIALFAGRPDDVQDWDEVADRATTAMEEARAQCKFTQSQMEHARGDFPTLGCGSSFGGGSMAPGVISNTKCNAKVLAALCHNPDIRRIAGFGSHMLASYAPRVHLKMQRRLRLLYERHPALQLNFSNSIYPAAAFNFGPNAVCCEHTDYANDPVNWCHVAALGRFDPQQGGHIILFNLRLVVEFPPGASVLMPSAIVPHANVPIQEGEVRLSFTQYCPGGLLRWVDAGFQTLKTLRQSDTAAQADFDAHLEQRTSSAVHYFSRYDQLLADLEEANKPEVYFPDLPGL